LQHLAAARRLVFVPVKSECAVSFPRVHVRHAPFPRIPAAAFINVSPLTFGAASSGALRLLPFLFRHPEDDRPVLRPLPEHHSVCPQNTTLPPRLLAAVHCKSWRDPRRLLAAGCCAP